MKGRDQLFSSAKTGGTDTWSTPQPFYDVLYEEFGFTLDPCANADNAKAAYFSIDEGVDGLEQDWGDNVVFVNFPYSDAKRWSAKCIDAAHKGATVVVLCAARTDTGWWQDLVNVAEEVRFVKGRLAFDNGKPNSATSATFPSSVIVLLPGLNQTLVEDLAQPNNEGNHFVGLTRLTLWEVPPEVRRGSVSLDALDPAIGAAS